MRIRPSRLIELIGFWMVAQVSKPWTATVEYAGPALSPDTSYSWTVKTWAVADGKPIGPSPCAESARFDTGLISAADWVNCPATNGGRSPWLG